MSDAPRKKRAKAPELPTMRFDSQAALEAWLAEQPPDARGIWLAVAKKGRDLTSVTRDESVESALCYGWIDGQARRIDDDYWSFRFTPRRARSRWSRINRDAAEALIASGRMREPGLREVERARADGRWDAAYEPPSTITVPDDFAAAMAASPPAAERFDALDARNRFAMLYNIHDAKRADTRARRIAKYVAMLLAEEKIH